MPVKGQQTSFVNGATVNDQTNVSKITSSASGEQINYFPQNNITQSLRMTEPLLADYYLPMM